MKRLPQAILDQLKEKGYVHITELGFLDRGYFQAHPYELGHYGHSEKVQVIVTEDGQIWVGVEILPTDLLEILCPNGLYVGGPLIAADIWTWDMAGLLKRLQDPYWGLVVDSTDESNEDELTFEEEQELEIVADGDQVPDFDPARGAIPTPENAESDLRDLHEMTKKMFGRGGGAPFAPEQ